MNVGKALDEFRKGQHAQRVVRAGLRIDDVDVLLFDQARKIRRGGIRFIEIRPWVAREERGPCRRVVECGPRLLSKIPQNDRDRGVGSVEVWTGVGGGGDLFAVE